MLAFNYSSISFPCQPSCMEINEAKNVEVSLLLMREFLNMSSVVRRQGRFAILKAKGSQLENVRIFSNKPAANSEVKKMVNNRKKLVNKGKKEHHLWQRKDAAGSGQKARSLLRVIADLPNEKEVVYKALDKWIAWEIEFPIIAAAKALRILRKRSQWLRAIQVAKWMLSKGQGTTMATYDTLLLAFDMDKRVDEAESLWNMILQTCTRSVSRRLFSRMISLYDHHDMPDKIIEVFADMEELGVRPDEDTVRRIAYAFQRFGQEEKQKLVLKRYQCKWKYIHFKGERVRVKRDAWLDS